LIQVVSLFKLLKLYLELTEFSLNPIVPCVVFTTRVDRSIIDGSDRLYRPLIFDCVNHLLHRPDVVLKSREINLFLLQIFLKVGDLIDCVIARGSPSLVKACFLGLTLIFKVLSFSLLNLNLPLQQLDLLLHCLNFVFAILNLVNN
jgi:hypothetical protein